MFINAEVRTYGAQGMRHEHPFAQIIVPLDGTMEIEAEGRGDRLTPSVFCALDIGAAHDFRATPGTRFLVFDVSERALAEHMDVTRGLPFKQRVRPIDPRARRLLRSQARELHDRSLPDLSRHMLSLAGLTLLAEGEAGVAPRRHANRIAEAARWIEEHASAGCSMTGVASRFGLSRSRFGELFRRELGRSPKQHELDARLARAVELLLETEESVSEIAFVVGYANVSSFTRTFTRRFAVTPSRFRTGKK